LANNNAYASYNVMEQSVDPMESQKRFDIEDSREESRRSPFPASEEGLQIDTPLDTPELNRKQLEYLGTPRVYSPVNTYRKVDERDAQGIESMSIIVIPSP